MGYKIRIFRLWFGAYFFVKPRKIITNGGNSMSIIEKDLVLATAQGIKYLKISKPTFLKIYPSRKNKSHQSGEGLGHSRVRVIPIFKG